MKIQVFVIWMAVILYITIQLIYAILQGIFMIKFFGKKNPISVR